MQVGLRRIEPRKPNSNRALPDKRHGGEKAEARRRVIVATAAIGPSPLTPCACRDGGEHGQALAAAAFLVRRKGGLR